MWTLVQKRVHTVVYDMYNDTKRVQTVVCEMYNDTKRVQTLHSGLWHVGSGVYISTALDQIVQHFHLQFLLLIKSLMNPPSETRFNCKVLSKRQILFVV